MTAVGGKGHLDAHGRDLGEFPIAKTKLDDFFLQWLSLPDTQESLAQLFDDAKHDRPLQVVSLSGVGGSTTDVMPAGFRFAIITPLRACQTNSPATQIADWSASRAHEACNCALGLSILAVEESAAEPFQSAQGAAAYVQTCATALLLVSLSCIMSHSVYVRSTTTCRAKAHLRHAALIAQRVFPGIRSYSWSTRSLAAHSDAAAGVAGGDPAVLLPQAQAWPLGRCGRDGASSSAHSTCDIAHRCHRCAVHRRCPFGFLPVPS